VKEVKKFYESKSRSLTLEVESALGDLNLESIEPLWKIIEMTSLEGRFRLCVNRKIQGAHEQSSVVKVIGLNQMLTLVSAKFQWTSEYCYEGTLSGRDVDGKRTIGASLINQALREITGNSWYDPEIPARKKLEEAFKPKPLVSVDAAIIAAVTPTEPTQPVPVSQDLSQKMVDIKGASRDFELTKRLFKEMSEIATSGQINSHMITAIMMKSIYGLESAKDKKCCGPVMAAWVRKGWLKREGKKSGVMVYSITDAAIKNFGLNAPSVIATNRDVKLIFDNSLLEGIRVVREKAEKFNTAKAMADELEMRKMQIEDEIKKIQAELDSLKPTIEDADLQKASMIWAGLQDSVPKTV